MAGRMEGQEARCWGRCVGLAEGWEMGARQRARSRRLMRAGGIKGWGQDNGVGGRYILWPTRRFCRQQDM